MKEEKKSSKKVLICEVSAVGVVQSIFVSRLSMACFSHETQRFLIGLYLYLFSVIQMNKALG
jgi:hypothetical protein